MKTHADREPQTSRRSAAALQEARKASGPAQGAAGNARDTAQRQRMAAAFGPAVAQKAGEEEEPLQGRFEAVQRVEEEEPLQGRFDTAQRMEEEEPLQGRFEAVQRVEEEEPLQGRFAAVAQAKANDTGLPDTLKAGVETLSGVSMDGVQVHYNSSKPAQLNALAYAQGRDIHVAPGQEQHLPHEAWHIAQQAQGRVQPTTQMAGGVAVNDDASLESEADTMGARALAQPVQQMADTAQLAQAVAQLRFDAGEGSVWHVHKGHIKLGNSSDSRVEFNGRSAKDIRKELGEKIERFGLNVGGDLATSFRECIDWINANC